MNNLGDVRENYTKSELSKEDLAIDPIVQFERWYQEVEKNKIIEPNAMTLATVSASGQPSARTVLLKGFSKHGFIFYTNYTSKKAQEIINHPQVALLMWWKELERQVRIEGTAQKVSQEVSSSYFQSRPRASQISAWASPQSQEIKEGYLTTKREQVESEFADSEKIPCPHFWGGFIVKPSMIEFWQGRRNRYHDRYQYNLSDDNTWNAKRLAP
jgi:pyridoxamine 5'-phosphate oxidase